MPTFKIPPKTREATNNVIDSILQVINILHCYTIIHLQFSMNSIEYIFNSPITRLVWSSIYNSVTSLGNQIPNDEMFVNIQIVHGKTEGNTCPRS